jgi:hypothetical protein
MKNWSLTFLWYDIGPIENDASNNSSVVAYVLLAARMCLPSRCLATKLRCHLKGVPCRVKGKQAISSSQNFLLQNKICLYSCCSLLEHRASVKRFVSLQFLNFYRCLHPVAYINTIVKLYLPSTHTFVVYYPVFSHYMFRPQRVISRCSIYPILYYCCIVRSLAFSCPKLLLLCAYIPITVIFCTWCYSVHLK